MVHMPDSDEGRSMSVGTKRGSQPLVAILGRPNVGKSTLFNRLVGGRVAVVEDMPGTTRDRIYGEIEWRGQGMAVVDTAGIAWPVSYTHLTLPTKA